MKKTKWISILTALAMTFSVFSLSASSLNLESQEEAMITDKMVFAAEMGKKYETALSRGEITYKTIEEKDELMMQYALASSEEKPVIENLLAECGIFVYTYNEKEEAAISPTSIWYPDSQANDVYIAAPQIYFDSEQNTWTVTCSGQWKNDNWRPYLPATTGNLGNVDAFGIGYTNAQTPYRSYVIRASASLMDQNNENRVTTTNRSDGDGSKGFGFRLQDKVLCPLFSDVLYVGYKWYGSCTYDANFATYDAVATAYYTHTYSTASITSIKFGIDGKNAGVEVVVANEEVSFTGFGPDTPLNNYGK